MNSIVDVNVLEFSNVVDVNEAGKVVDEKTVESFRWKFG